MQFPATACEDSSSASLIVRNSSSDCSSVFEFGVPSASHIKVCGGGEGLHDSCAHSGGCIDAFTCLANRTAVVYLREVTTVI